MTTQLTQFLAKYGAGDGVFYLGHAGILAVLNGRKILFDPIIESQPYGDSWVFFPPQIDEDALYDVDAVVVSHIHQDHYDLPFLRRLAPSVKVVILGGRPSFLADIQANSGRDITIIPPETVTELFSGVKLFGVTHETNGIDSSMIAYNDRFCVYHGNDNYLQPASMAKFNGVASQIDVACIPYAYIHWYPFLMEYPADRQFEKQAEADRLVNHYMDDCLDVIGILKPRIVIPFGANLLIDDGNMHSDINMAVRTPVEFTEYARAKLPPEQRDVVQPMLAGDYCGLDGGQLQLTIAHVYDAAEYRAAADDFLRARPAKAPRSSSAEVDLDAFLAKVNKRLRERILSDPAHQPIDNVLQFELPRDQGLLRVEVDCLDCQARVVPEFTEGRPIHRFRLDAVSAAEWLSGKRFEFIIGMRRFTLLREPNQYLPEVLKIINTAV
ncbi:MAG TPA: MBL fold metallo-hydrolase [Pseudoduganella sp.]